MPNVVLRVAVIGAVFAAGMVDFGCVDREPPPPPRRRVVVVEQEPPPAIVYEPPPPAPGPEYVFVQPVYVRERGLWVRHPGYYRRR